MTLQAALEYLNRWVPAAERTAVMYNTVLSSIVQRGRDKALFDTCLAQMEGSGLRRDPKTWSLLAKRQAGCVLNLLPAFPGSDTKPLDATRPTKAYPCVMLAFYHLTSRT